MRTIKVGDVYLHFKGAKVKVLALAKDSESLDDLVVYKHLDTDENWVRGKKEFLSEVDHKKYPDVKQKYRFELVKEGK